MAATDIFVRIKGVDKISGMLKGIKGRVGGLGKALKVVGMVGGAALVGVGIAALKFGNDFKEAENIIRTGTGATGEALGDLYEDFKAAFAEVPGDMKVVAQTTADLNTALGLTGKPLQDLTVQVMELGRITETDVATILPKVTRLFGDWSVATEDQEAALDNVFKASQATGAPVERLSDLLVKYGAPLRQFNYGMEEGAAMLGKWEKEGVNTELVMGGLRKSMSKFAREGTPLREGLDATIKKIQELGPGAESTALAMDTFGVISGPDMAAAILEGKFAIDDLVGTIAESDDSIMKVAEDTMTWQDKLRILKNKALVALEPALTKFIDLIGEAANWLGDNLPGAIETVGKAVKTLNETYLTPLAKAIGAVWDAIGPVVDILILLVKKLSKVKVVMKALGAVALTLVATLVAIKVATMAHVVAMKAHAAAMKAAKIAQALWKVATKAAAVAQWLLNAALSANPIGIVVIAIAALVAGLVYFFTQTEIGQKIITKAWDIIKSAFQSALNGLIALIGFLKDSWTEIKEVFTKVVDDIIDAVEDIPEVFTKVVDDIIDTMENVPEVFTEVVDDIVDTVENIPVIGEIFKGTMKVIGDKIEALKGFIQGLIDFVQELVRFVKAIFRGDWAAAWDSLKNLAQISLNLFLDFLQLTFI
ncbi:hypothetical protein LCGC14_0662740, partial [marine sediment metagenome]